MTSAVCMYFDMLYDGRLAVDCMCDISHSFRGEDFQTALQPFSLKKKTKTPLLRSGHRNAGLVGETVTRSHKLGINIFGVTKKKKGKRADVNLT